MRKKETEEFFKNLYSQDYERKTNTNIYLENHLEQLIEFAIKYEQKAIDDALKQQQLVTREKLAWQNKKCLYCSSPLKLIHNDFGNFWGCSNYKANEMHSKFNDNSQEVERIFEYKFEKSKVRINAHWLTDLKYQLDMPKYIRPINILNTLKSNGFDDLRLKYGYKPTIETISSYPIAKKISREEETEIKQFLSKYYKNIVFQQGIKYKLINEKEKKCFVDIIVSDDSTVNIIEIKRDIVSIRPKQLNLYFELVKYIMNNKKDKRFIQSLFIVSNPIYYSSEFYEIPKHILFTELKNKITSKKEIDYEFKKNCIQQVV
ncbi:MAG: hypothetical protein AB7S48_15730 [Bacteroidales bacterium]